jgi:hypothetical protein
MGREQITNPCVERIIAGKASTPPANWLPRLDKGTANHRLLDLAIAVELERSPATARWQALEVARDQVTNGLGAVLGSVEMWTPAPHAELHLNPTVALALIGHRRGDTELRDAWVEVLSHWRGLCHFGASDDGQVALPGTRFWGYRQKPPRVAEDGLYHLKPGATLSQVWDAFCRQTSALPQRDNKGKARTPKHVQAMASFQGVAELLEAGVEIPRARSVPMTVLYTRNALTDDGVMRAWLGSSEVGGSITGLAPAVRATWREPGKHLIAWAPNAVPQGDEWAMAR